MHGADPKTPISLIENVSKQNQRILSTTLSELPKCISQYDISGPVLTLYGLAPREASHVTAFIDRPNDMPSEMELA
jgi:uroporphyrin-III C-methyltransferase/precorrin-2 dehydrogenase/sirohydrochlorin ferrochelatase